MPYPQNLSTAQEVEAMVRSQGATPATIAVLQGRLHVGLSHDQLLFLSRSPAPLKVSRRDLPYVLSRALSGGTTVSGTMLAAHRASIPVFVTGGVGGVHRDGENSMDVSADLTELGRTPIAVVSAGVKSILDIGRTLEFLSGFTSPHNVTNAEEAAELIEAMLSVGLQSGVLLAVPIPEEHAAAGEITQEAVRMAVAQASVTRGAEPHPPAGSRPRPRPPARSRPGAAPPRREQTPPTPPRAFGQTNPGSVYQSYGGVGRNIADCMARLGEPALLISAVGADTQGEALLSHCSHMDTRGVARIPGHRTATYCAVITGGGELSLGLGDMDIHQQITAQYVTQFEDLLSTADLICLDGNIPVSTIDYVCSVSRKYAVPVWYEPTDTDKAPKPFLSDSWRNLSYTSPNLAELCAMNQTLGLPTPAVLPGEVGEVLGCAVALCRPLLEHLQCVLVTLGPLGVLLCGEQEGGAVRLSPRKQPRTHGLCAVHYPAVPLTPGDVVNVSGAGDSLAGAVMAGALRGLGADDSVRLGLLAACLSLASPHPIAPSLSAQTVSLETIQSHAWPQPSCHWIGQ
ncbi:hypothetical protein COCON_G00227810 [Conger conger]|uniref:Carbohydrate kinase PfkB domain-containing protein n=1 Tax=Conger conger TaxID=82655 RepID=A0A9Q1CUG3_CONCO|nr:hypothetical protein COCON_G00227810 [Conger conger]